MSYFLKKSTKFLNPQGGFIKMTEIQGKICGNFQGTEQGLLLKNALRSDIIHSSTKTREERYETENDFKNNCSSTDWNDVCRDGYYCNGCR